MSDPGSDLAALLRRRLVALLTGAADALGETLDALPPQAPAWPQAAVGASLLAPLDTAASPDAVAAAVLRLLAGTLRAPTGDANLHGWTGETGGRGVAYAVRAGAAPGDLAVALVSDGDAVVLLASGATAAAVTVGLRPGW